MAEGSDPRQPRVLTRIDTDIPWSNLPNSPNIDTLSPFPPSNPIIFTDETGQLLPTSPDPVRRPQPANKAKALSGTRKLLSHVLTQLADRQKPPPVVQTISLAHTEAGVAGIASLAGALKGAVKASKKPPQRLDRSSPTDIQDDSDDDINQEFTTDETFNLLSQLKDVLNLSVSQGWQLFEDETPWQLQPEELNSRLSSFRRSRRLSKSPDKRSRSASPNRNQIDVPELLSFCISILASIVLEDCRYRIGTPRPSRPPFSLQILVLNIAQFLVYSHRQSPTIISQISDAMIPAFITFPNQLHTRLVNFFETSIIRAVVQNLDVLFGTTPLLIKDVDPLSPDENYTITVEQPDDPSVSIRVEGPSSGNQPSLPPRVGSEVTIQSTNNPNQSPHIYHLSFILPPLLSALLESLGDPLEPFKHPNSVPAILGLLSSIKAKKVDLYNDLLEIVAFQSSNSRRYAIALLAQLYPKATGHSIISSPLPLAPFRISPDSRRHPYLHQFVPWIFSQNRRHARFNVLAHDDCKVCERPINGCALSCPFCMTSVHFDCYDDPFGNYQIQYAMAEDRGTQRIAIHRFSNVMSSDYSNANVREFHHFVLVNFFTLCLCYGCKRPLWGHVMQGLKCVKCSMAIHASCIDAIGHSDACGYFTFTSKEFTITPTDLDASFSQFAASNFPSLSTAHQPIGYEEASIYSCVVRIQLQILQHGLEMGSIVVSSKARNSRHDPTALLIQLKRNFDDFLSGTQPLIPSIMTQQYYQDNPHCTQQDIFFDWSFLEYVTSDIKGSTAQADRMERIQANDLLAVQIPLDPEDTTNEVDPTSLEMVSVSHLRRMLARDFGIHSEFSGRLMINHLLHLSFLERLNQPVTPFMDLNTATDVRCVFPFPLGLDLSVNVETLVSACEGALGDLDLSANEFAFLLLTRRLWPNGISSDFVLKRLCGRILLWILDEDESLATILREYVGRQKRLPGIRAEHTYSSWPPPQDPRVNSSYTANNGGDYVAVRRHLLARYAIPWLLTTHNLDPELYAEVAFTASVEASRSRKTAFEYQPVLSPSSRSFDSLTHFDQGDDVLRSLMKLSQSSVVFSVFDDIFLRWIEQTVQLSGQDKPLASLTRFFNNDVAPTQRSMSTASGIDRTSAWNIDPLRAILDLAGQSPASLPKSLCYLHLVSASGVTIPLASFKQFESLITPRDSLWLDNFELLAKSMFKSLWLKSMGRQGIQDIIGSLHIRLQAHLQRGVCSSTDFVQAFSALRFSLASCLLLYGCDRTALVQTRIVDSSETQNFSMRRKLARRGSEVVDPIIVDTRVLSSLEMYLSANVEEVTCLVAKFFHVLLTESALLEGPEVDNFVLRNGALLCRCVWDVYGIQREDILVARTTVLLRCLVVEPDPFNDLITRVFKDNPSTPDRLSGATRLFRMVSDVTSPAFHVEGRQWKSTVIDIFYFYFTGLWTDPDVLVRLAIKTSAATLLPAHTDMISQCWNEALVTAPIVDRIRLISFLTQLHPHFPNWKLLSWEAIIDALDQCDPSAVEVTAPGLRHILDTDSSESSQGNRQSYSDAGDIDMLRLRASTLILSLHMLASGVEIDAFSLMKLKSYYVQLTGFTKVVTSPSNTGHFFHLQLGEIYDVSEYAYPCIEELAQTIDSAHRIEVPCSILGCESNHSHGKVLVLVGSVFADIPLSIVGSLRDLTSLPVLTLKSLLDILYIVIQKIDFDDDLFQGMKRPLKKAVLASVELLSKDVSYEVRQLAMTIGQATIKRWHSFLGATVANILHLVASELANQDPSSQDSLVVQGRILIGTALHSFANIGLLYSLMKRPLSDGFFAVVKQTMATAAKDAGFVSETLCDQLLRDTLARAAQCDVTSFQSVVQNIFQYVKVVFSQEYTAELMSFVGQHLTHLGRRMADGSITAPNCAPLIGIPLILIERNKKTANLQELLPYLDTLLRTVLTRLPADAVTLTRVIKVATGTKTRAAEPGQSQYGIVGVLFELLADGFRGKTKMSAATIAALIESLETLRDYSHALVPQQYDILFRTLVEDAYNFLQVHQWVDENIDNDFNAMFGTATLVLRNTLQDPLSLQRMMQPVGEKRHHLTLRTWNMLLLAALRNEQNDPRATVYSCFPSFMQVYSTTLRKYTNAGVSAVGDATFDVNQAHVSMKLWIMLAQAVYDAQRGEHGMLAIWNELWAPYDAFLNVLEVEGRAGLNPALISLATSSIADVIVYMRILRAPTSLDVSSTMALLARMKALNPIESSTGKITRAMRGVSEPPPLMDPVALLDQTGKEMIAAEKLRALDGKRDVGRVGGERFKRDMRFQM